MESLSNGNGNPKFNHESYFLEGPHSRVKDFRFTLHVMREFIKGFRVLHFVGPCVAVFGSARFGEEHPYYRLGVEVGRAVANLGFGVMTGGGPGIMEAANRGAKEAGGLSVGCNIRLPHEQHTNKYLDRSVTFEHFFVRKVLMFKYSYAFIVLPGGMGTMDELFEALTLVQTGKIKEFPIILIGKEYWKNLMDMLDIMVKNQTIRKEDLDIFLLTDSVEEAISHIRETVTDNPELLKKNVPRPLRFIGEKVYYWR